MSMEDSAITRLTDYGLIDNREIKLLEVLKEALTCGSYKEIYITVGFLFISGLKTLENELDEFFSSGGKLKIVMGNLTNKLTYEQLSMAYHSIERLKKVKNKSMFSNKNNIVENAELINENINVMEQSDENEKFIQKLVGWMESGAFEIRVYMEEYMHAKTYIFHPKTPGTVTFGVVGSSNFSLSGFSGNTEMNASIFGPQNKNLYKWFDEIWKNSKEFNPVLLDYFKSRSWAFQRPGTFPPPYHVLIRGLYELYRDQIEADVTTGLLIKQIAEVLYDFQMDAARRAVRIVDKYGGVLISDVVGLGKTFIALAVAQDIAVRNLYEGKEHKIAVIAPANLVQYWEDMLKGYGIEGKVFSAGYLPYDENPKFIEMSNYIENCGVVIVDESHRYTDTATKSYANLQKLLSGKKSVLLTATPYRKRYNDILNQIRLFIHGNRHPFPLHPPTWDGLAKEMENGHIDPSYVLREIMVRRTRYDILSLYGGEGNCLTFKDKTLCFPERKLNTVTYSITDIYGKEDVSENIRQILTDGATETEIEDVYALLVAGISSMKYARFNLWNYVRENFKNKSPYNELSAAGKSLRGLTKILLLKRLESSWYAFWWTLYRDKIKTKNFLKLLEHKFIPAGDEFDYILLGYGENRELSDDEIVDIIENVKSRYKAGAFHITKLKEELEYDLKKIEAMLAIIEPVKAEIEKDVYKDSKLKKLIDIIEKLKARGVKKILVFSEYAETVQWIHSALKKTGHASKWKVDSVSSRTGGILNKVRRFSPRSNAFPVSEEDEIDVMIATDVLSEGLNLQDANVVVNYDLHWTPLKLIQRIGRIDRIGTEHDTVEIYNFFPETELDKKLGLIDKISRRIEEFNRSLGSDGKILSDMEEWNPSAISAIYGEDISAIENMESKLGISITTEAERLVRDFMDKYPEEFEKLKKTISMRSICKTNVEEPLGFFVCSDGVTTQYYTYRYKDMVWESTNEPLEKVIAQTSLTYDTPPVREADMALYYSAANAALEEFKKMREEIRGSLIYRKRKIPKNVKTIFIKLKTYHAKLKTPGEKEELRKILELVQWGYNNDEPFANSLRRIKSPHKISADKIVEACRTLIDKHNIPIKKKQIERRIREQGEGVLKPHIVAGLIFLP